MNLACNRSEDSFKPSQLPINVPCINPFYTSCNSISKTSVHVGRKFGYVEKLWLYWENVVILKKCGYVEKLWLCWENVVILRKCVFFKEISTNGRGLLGLWTSSVVWRGKREGDVSGTRSVYINRREVGERTCCVGTDTDRRWARRRDDNIILTCLELTNRKKRRW